MSSKESNVTGVIFDLFFMIKTRPVLAGKLALVLAGRWVSLKESNVILRIPPIRKVRHVSSKESNVMGVIFDSFSCHMAGDLIIFP